jgi:hypothetical protein
MPLTAFRTSECLAVMQRLLSYQIASMFAQPVDPVRDSCPTYFDLIQHPMDLGTVCSKLENNEYDTITQWRQDIALIWDNACTFNGPTSLVVMLARQLQLFFKEWTEYITVDEKTDWLNKLDDLRNHMSTVRGESPTPMQAQKPLKVKIRDPDPKPAKSAKKLTQKIPKSSPPPRSTLPTRSQSVQLPQKFTYDQIEQLVEDVNLLAENDDIMAKIVELITQNEPHLMKEEEVEIEVSRLRTETLWALRKLINRFSM